VKVLIGARAEREIRRKADSWVTHSTISPELFWDELRAALRRLAVEPYAGRVWTSPSGRQLYRLLLPATSNHLYYSYDAEKEILLVRSLWGARRGREPKL
jgi:plasmid stabilization system protein ParE